MYDAKDIEIARLKGQVEALERTLAAMRAVQPSVPAPAPQVWPWTVPAYPVGPSVLPTLGPHGGFCACPTCCPVFYTTTAAPPQPGAGAGCAPAPFIGTEVWVGNTRAFVPDLVIGGEQRPGIVCGSISSH